MRKEGAIDREGADDIEEISKTYQRPALTVDGIVVIDDRIVLVKRDRPPFKGELALPGGFVEYGEKVEDAVRREVREETGLSTRIVRLLGVYSDPERDPRGHTISIVFVLEAADKSIVPGSDAATVELLDLDRVPKLAFDHSRIIRDYLRSEALQRSKKAKKHN
ncbi:MAG: NUDIX hydrolase [Methanomassiliicoccales archaeon]|nr:NUDIX hydrolase [Methanomassiliicoccales archaeon]